MTTLLLAEQKDGHLNDITARALTAAKELGEPVHGLVLGKGAAQAATALAKLDGIEKVHVVEGLEHDLAEPVAALLVRLSDQHPAIVAPASVSAKNILPRVAALLDVMQISEISKVVAPDTFERPIYAGNAIATVQSGDAKKVITVRTAGFAIAGEKSPAAPVEPVAAPEDPGLSTFQGEALAKLDRPELTSAKIIISGGRAMQNRENFTTYIEPVADKLGAAMGASRAAVDAGYAPNDWQVGQTGKVVAPGCPTSAGRVSVTSRSRSVAFSFKAPASARTSTLDRIGMVVRRSTTR